MQDPTLPLSGDHLWDSLQEVKQAFVQLSGNIQSYDEAAMFFPPSQTYFTDDIPSPFITGLAYLLRPPYVQLCSCCSIPVVSARKLFREQQNQRDLKS